MRVYGCFYIVGGPFRGCPSSKSPTYVIILGSLLARPLIFGNLRMGFTSRVLFWDYTGVSINGGLVLRSP